MFQPVNTLVKERESSEPKNDKPKMALDIIQEDEGTGNNANDGATDKINEILNQFEKKLDSAHRKFVPAFGGPGAKKADKNNDAVSSFSLNKGRDSIVLIEGSI